MVSKLNKQAHNIDSGEIRENISLSLSRDLVEQTEEAIYQLRKGLPMLKRRKLNRNQLYRLILQNALSNKQKEALKLIIFEWSKNIPE